MKIDSDVCKRMVEAVFGKSDWRRLRKFKDDKDRTVREFEDGIHQVVTVISAVGDKEIALIGKGAYAVQPPEPALAALNTGSRHEIRVEYCTYDNDALDKLFACFTAGNKPVKVVMDEDGDNADKRTFEFNPVPGVLTVDKQISKEGYDDPGYYELVIDSDPRDFICMLMCLDQCAGCGHGLSINVYVGGKIVEELGFDGDGSDSIQAIKLDGKEVKQSYAPYNYEATL
jgi:hypothetical protein